MPPRLSLLRLAARGVVLLLSLLMLWDAWDALDALLLHGPPTDRAGMTRLLGNGILLAAGLLGLGGLALRGRRALAAATLVALAGSLAMLAADWTWRVETGAARLLPEPQTAFGMLVLLPLPFLLASRTYAPGAALRPRERLSAWRGRLDALAEEP